MSLLEKPAETAERKAFYDKIDKQSLAPLWTVLSNIITPGAQKRVRVAPLALRRCEVVPARSGWPDYREGSRASRSHP